jgi:hypothetical protein
MLKVSRLVSAGALVATLVSSAPAFAESAGSEIKLGRLVAGPGFAPVAKPSAASAAILPGGNFALHAGLMFLPRGAVDVGADVSVPSWTIGDGWVPRFDANFLIGADVEGDEDALSLTGNVVKMFPALVYDRDVYFGGGVGWLLTSGGFQAKLILGTPITDRFDIEANTHFVEGTVIWTILARARL